MQHAKLLGLCSTGKDYIEWIYSLLVLPDSEGRDNHGLGFRGGTYIASDAGEGAHLAMTYTALASLIVLGDDLSRLDGPVIARSLRHFQQVKFLYTHFKYNIVTPCIY